MKDKHGDIHRNLKRKMKHNTEPLRQLVIYEEEDNSAEDTISSVSLHTAMPPW